MRKVLFIFADLNDSDMEWLAAIGERKTFRKGGVLVQEGKPMFEVYILLDGLLSVSVTTQKGILTRKTACQPKWSNSSPPTQRPSEIRIGGVPAAAWAPASR